MNGGERDRQRIDAVLAERARMLARPIAQVDPVPTVDVVDFVCGEQRYAIETPLVYRIERLGRVTPLPGAPQPFAGITNVHGQLVPLVDPGRLLGAPACVYPVFVIVLGTMKADIGLVADDVRDIRAVPFDQVQRRMTADGTTIIDGAAVLADPRLVVGPSAAVTPLEENVL